MPSIPISRRAAFCIAGESECPTGCPSTQNTRVRPPISPTAPLLTLLRSDDRHEHRVPTLCKDACCPTAQLPLALAVLPAAPAPRLVLSLRADQDLHLVGAGLPEGLRGVLAADHADCPRQEDLVRAGQQGRHRAEGDAER